MKRQLLLSIRAQDPADLNTCLNEGFLLLTQAEANDHITTDLASTHAMQVNANINDNKEYDWPVGLWARS